MNDWDFNKQTNIKKGYLVKQCMNDSASKINRYIKIAKINTIKYCELVYPVHNKRGAPVVDPDCTDDGQEEGEAC